MASLDFFLSGPRTLKKEFEGGRRGGVGIKKFIRDERKTSTEFFFIKELKTHPLLNGHKN